VAVKVLNRATIALDDRLIVVSEACRRSLPRSLQARATVVVHGIELEPIRAAVARRAELRAAVRSELGCSDDALLAVTVAGLRWPKGHDVLLEAARHVLDAGCAVHFVAVGDGARRGDLEAQRRRLGLDGSVVFVGERPDVARFLAAADLYVLPSRQEGLPLALMEALSSGLPVVATAVSEIPTLLTDGVDALVVPPESARALADAVVELARDESLRARLGARALGLADRFDVGRCVAEVESIYDEVCPLPVRQGS
jgi:glycosyltransferase involved in cell wall biosynthesis